MEVTMKEQLANIDYPITNAKKFGGSTIIFNSANGDTVVRLYDTDIFIKYDDSPHNRIKLDSGGYQTNTTKDRINTAFSHFGYGDWRIIQRKGIWYIYNQEHDAKITFFDGIILTETQSKGLSVLNADYIPNEKEIKKLRKDIKNYSKKFIEFFMDGKIEKPSESDCWYCAFLDDGGSTQHLRNHLYEPYYVPSLLNNALSKNKLNVPSEIVKIFVYYQWMDIKNNPIDKNSPLREVIKKQLTTILEKFLLRKLSMPI